VPKTRSSASKRRKAAYRRRTLGEEGVQARPAASRPWLIAGALALLTLAAFWPVFENEFVNYDDPEYVEANSVVRNGLTAEGVRWAFTAGRAANWHPLTWLSHMTDVSLFGLRPIGHHATSLLLHAANTLLLFFLLRRMTGESVRSGFVAALFAIHPAHVESVAWVAERKDVLSTAFWLLTTATYVAWVDRKSTARYALLLALFAAGLMSKPMLVSLPVTLLLLDYWPLERIGAERPTRLVVEKAPLFVLAAASSVVTLVVQRAGGAVRTSEYPLGVRVANALVSVARYLEMLVWPRLSAFYPYDRSVLTPVRVFGAAALLAGITAAAVALRRRAPELLVGWLWFLVTLLPVAGLVQVGKQALADRYTYVPYIGLFVAIVWGFSRLVAGRRSARLALSAAALAVIFVLGAATSARARIWRNSETLFLDAIDKTKGNYLAHINLASHYIETGRVADAMPHLREAERIRPDEPELYVHLGYADLLEGRRDEAARSFERVLELAPRHGVALNNLARIRFLDGDVPEALRLYRATVAVRPDWAEGRRRLAVVLLMVGDTTSAIDELRLAVALDPSDAEAQMLLTGALARAEGRKADAAAIEQFLADVHREAARALRGRGRTAEAAAQESQAQSLTIPSR
jgi:protein O-mannosyl-transferase